MTMLPLSQRLPPARRGPGTAAYWTVTREGIHLRPMAARDAARIRDFLLAQYEAFNAVDNTPQGHGVFRDFVSAEALRARLAAGSIIQVAERRGTLLGVCEIHQDGYLTLLYIRADHQGRGLGRRLLGHTLQRVRALVPDLERLRVRGTPYARSFYARLGFIATASERQEDQGLRYHPFELPLDAAAAPVTGT